MVINPENPKQLIAKIQSAPLILYGMGGAGLRIAQWCDENDIEYVFADRDARKKQNTTNKTVVLPDILKEKYLDSNIVISSIIYYDEITDELIKLGIEKKRILSYKQFMPDHIMWLDLDNNIDWELMRFRVELFSKWMTNDIKSVADYGAGRMFLQEYLNTDVTYFPIDYIRRNEQTILCDLNLGQFPCIQADATICSGVLEFISTSEKLLKHIGQNTNKMVILSYVTIDKFPDIDGRRASAYISDLSDRQILDFMASSNFFLDKKVPDPLNSACAVYLFRKKDNPTELFEG